MEFLFQKQREADDTPVTSSDLKTLGYWSVIGLFGVLVAGYGVNFVQYLNSLALTSYDSLIYACMIAAAEECFFRGFITDYLLTTFAFPWIGLVASAAIFCAYHFARYGTDVGALIYVFIGGLVLSFVAYKSQRITPSLAAHMAVNFIALSGVS